jgi:hypothetical protein
MSLLTGLIVLFGFTFTLRITNYLIEIKLGSFLTYRNVKKAEKS